MSSLVAGDVEGRFNQLFKRITSVNQKNGPFSFLLCVGDFFGADNSQWLPYKSGALKGRFLWKSNQIRIMNDIKAGLVSKYQVCVRMVTIHIIFYWIIYFFQCHWRPMSWGPMCQACHPITQTWKAVNCVKMSYTWVSLTRWLYCM